VVPVESVGENCAVNFQKSQFQAQQASINLLIVPGLLGHFWSRNLLKTPCAYRRKTRRNRKIAVFILTAVRTSNPT
jgi:hypothetical protein